MATSPTYSLRARYIFPIDRSPIRDGWITISGKRIDSVGHDPTGDYLDLGDVAILPGLINAHTHLEFSDLDVPLGEAGMPFTQWIREVVRYRRAAIEQETGTEWRSEAIRQGIAESIRGGATTLGEILTLPWDESGLRYGDMQGVSFLELLGLAPERHDELLAAANAYIEDAQSRASSPQPGLSPHAPYTVSPQLVESVAALSARARIPVAMHLAETREELDLLWSGRGPFRELLDDLGAWHHDVIPANSTPMDYLRLLAKADRSLIIHGNYLSQEEVEFAGQQNKRMSIIYCPRTHAYFGHDQHPLRKMLDAGVNVALGTDSRASNSDLNMLSELRFVARQHEGVSPEVVLRLATINAAKALGLDGTLGSLTPGKQADFVVVPVSSNVRSDPHELLLESSQSVQHVFLDGKQLIKTYQ